MAKKIKDQPLSILIQAQQIIQHASTEMHGFFGHVDKEHKDGKISTSYHAKLENNLRNRIEKNNEWINDLEKEMYSRIERDFPGVTTTNIMRIIVPNFEKEQRDFLKEMDKVKTDKPKGKTLDLNISKEKKV